MLPAMMPRPSGPPIAPMLMRPTIRENVPARWDMDLPPVII